jgi:hypothetical protein
MELSMSIFQTVEAALIAAGQKIESVLEPKALALWNIGKSAFAQMEALGIPQLEADRLLFPLPNRGASRDNGIVRCQQRLGDLLKYHEREAA